MRWLILLVILLAHRSVNADDWRIPHNRMKTLYSQGDYRAALPYAEEALRLSSQEFGERHATTVVLLANVGLVHNKLGDNEKAASFLRRSVVAEMGVSGAKHPKVAKGLMDLGLVYEELGDDGLAEIAFTRALAIYRSTLGDNASETKRAAKFVERVSQKQLLAHAAQTKPPVSTPAIARSRARQPSSPSTPEALQKPRPSSYENGHVQNDALSQYDAGGEYTPTQRAVALAVVVIGLGSLCLQFCAPSAFGSAATHVVTVFRSIRRQFAAAMEARARANAEKQKRIDKQLEEMRAKRAEEQRLERERQKKMAEELAVIAKEAPCTHTKTRRHTDTSGTTTTRDEASALRDGFDLEGFTYGEWRIISLAPIGIFAGVMSLINGESAGGLFCFAVAAAIIYVAYRRASG